MYEGVNTITTHLCPKCKEEKPLEKFKSFYVCKECSKAYERKRWASQPQEKRRAKWLKTKYNLLYATYEQMFLEQNGKCKVCDIDISITTSSNSHSTACVDHSHSTGKVRSLLCNHCNRALGLLKENEKVIANLLKYIRSFNE